MRSTRRVKKLNTTSPSYFFNKALVAMFMVGLIAFAPDAFASPNSPMSKVLPKLT